MLLKCHLVLAIAHFRPSKLSSSLEECIFPVRPRCRRKENHFVLIKHVTKVIWLGWRCQSKCLYYRWKYNNVLLCKWNRPSLVYTVPVLMRTLQTVNWCDFMSYITCIIYCKKKNWSLNCYPHIPTKG